jgi:hypothetical protein
LAALAGWGLVGRLTVEVRWTVRALADLNGCWAHIMGDIINAITQQATRA